MRDERAKRRFEAVLAQGGLTQPARRVVVLCYHSIHPSKLFASATPRRFDQQLEWLLANCDVVPFESIAKLPPSIDGTRPVVAITFDDGYEDNYTFALPILQAHDVHATFFVTTGLIDNDARVVGRFARLWHAFSDDVRGLTWTQLSEMWQAGLAIGAHTYSHPNLKGIGARFVREEITRSRTTIEEHLQETVRLFAYPYGRPRQHVSRETVEIVSSLGFESAATIHYRGFRLTDSVFAIPRFAVTQDSMRVFVGKIRGHLDVIGLWQERMPLPLAHFFSAAPTSRRRP